MKIEYDRCGDCLFPNLTIEETGQSIGKYGRLRKQYLKEHRPTLYSNLLLSGKLFEHLSEIDRAAQDRIDRIASQLAAQRGITEQLKADDQMRWVQEMNNIQAAAEEIILQEMIYSD